MLEINYWFVLVILVTISIGIVSFINKVFASRKYDPKFSAMVLYGVMFSLSFVYLLFKGYYGLLFKDLLLSIVYGFQIYSYSLIMMFALRYLPTSTYFIGVRLCSSFLLLGVGIIFFGDVITSIEAIGLVFGVLAMFLLFEKEEKEGIDYKRGLIILFIGVFSLVLGHSITKIFSFDIDAVPILLTITFLSAFIFSIIFGFKSIKSNLSDFKPIFLINLLQGALYMFYFVVLFYVYRMGDLGISYKIMSYSPFIPIILSIIVYGEKVSSKKVIAFLLTVLSLWFFV